MLRIVADAVRKVLQGVRWSYAFDANDFGQRQTQARQLILDVLEQQTAVSASSQLPTYQQFAVIFPRRAVLPLADLLSFHRRRGPGPAAGTAQPVGAPASEPAPVSHTNPWHGRLRSSSALSLAQDAEEKRGGQASAAAAVGSSGARSSGDSAVRPPYVERLFIPIVRPRAPLYRKRKWPER